MRIGKLAMALALSPSAAVAQGMTENVSRANTVLVAATGTVETPPDTATLALVIRGEGKNPDAATAALAGKQKAVLAGLRALDAKLEVRTGSVSIREVHKGNCSNIDLSSAMSADDLADGMDAAADTLEALARNDTAIAKGPCIVSGNLAEMSATVLTGTVKDAGTMVGLAARLGASAVRIESFGLRDTAAAERQAAANAVVDARVQAQAIAAASGAKLGPLVSVTDADATARNRFRGAFAGLVARDVMMLEPPPIVVDVHPRPVETAAQLLVTFALLP